MRRPHRRRAAAVGGYTTAVLSGLIGRGHERLAGRRAARRRVAARGLRVPSRNALLADVVPANA
jgi:hypothetical protein